MLLIQQYPTPDNTDGMTYYITVTNAILFCTTFAWADSETVDELYETRSIQLGYGPNQVISGLAYDAVWALALGLNQTQEMFLSNYNVTEIGCDDRDGGWFHWRSLTIPMELWDILFAGTCSRLTSLDVCKFIPLLLSLILPWKLSNMFFFF